MCLLITVHSCDTHYSTQNSSHNLSSLPNSTQSPLLNVVYWTSTTDWNIPSLTRLEENLIRLSVDDFTWQTERITRLYLATAAVCINTQLVVQLHGVWQSVTNLQHFTPTPSSHLIAISIILKYVQWHSKFLCFACAVKLVIKINDLQTWTVEQSVTILHSYAVSVCATICHVDPGLARWSNENARFSARLTFNSREEFRSSNCLQNNIDTFK